MEIASLADLVKRDFHELTVFKEIVRLEKWFFPKYPYDIKDIKQACQKSNGCTLILLDKNKVIGYLIPLFFKNKNYLQILTIAVNKKYQKKGCGTKLLERCEETAKSLKLKKIIIRTDVSYPILKTLKNLKFTPMKLEEIKEFAIEGIFSANDRIKKVHSPKIIANLLPKAYIITKDIGKENPFSFIPMIKDINILND